MNERYSAVAQAQKGDRAMIPAVDITEIENEVVLEADMPGVSKDSLSIHLENDVLRIEGTIEVSSPENARRLLAEMPSRRYARSFTLGRELDSEHIQAEMRDGVLKLRIPKSDASKPRRIEVSSN